MARKKTVSISRKPPADSVEPVGGESAAQPGLSPLAMTLQPYADILHDEPASVRAALSLGPVGRVVYGTVFCLSYGVVYSAVLIGQFIPGGRVLGHALRDGAGAAERSFADQPPRCAEAKRARLAA